MLAPICSVAFDYAVDTVIFEGAAGTTKIKITASTRPFVRAAHKTTELRNAGTQGKQDWRSATVDGKRVIGTDQTLPKDGLPQLSALNIWFGDAKISVPAEHLNHVFLPHMLPATIQKGYAETLVAISADAKAIHLSLGVGDGGGSGTYDLLIESDGTVSASPVRRPGP
ncbi:hypothetical protein BGE01nite_52150 [Brevifollis gellanilyticus]|uniref:Uncharacterized protein n=1 Tax=Brevifollis gellanilyticus TaxID=748831 RepID=A0A512MGS3_9BACT|nr:hypothetical protein BGE01nite_52150 [Brevifollis gellanilyticus]